MTLAIAPRAQHYPDRTALIDHTTGEHLTYRRLADAASESTDRFATHDVTPGDHVVVLSRNRPELVSWFFGLHRHDATLAPVSYRLASETIADLVDRIDPTLLLYEERFADLAPDTTNAMSIAEFRDTTITTTEATETTETPGSTERTTSRTTGRTTSETTTTREDAADGAVPPLFLHTGGTTGVPKVVPITTRQLEWNCITEVAAWGLGRETVSPILLPQFHTGGWTLLTLPTLYVGGTVVIAREFDPGDALEMVERYGATQLFGVAAIFAAMADHPAFPDTDFSTVDWVMSGGGPTPEAVMEPYRDRDIDFVTGYGLTEGGPNNLYVDPSRSDRKPGSVGRPFPDCEARIVDDDGNPVGTNEVGELEIAGPVTADGYLETTDGTFDGDWVSTGDLARRDAAGDYYITGRVDNMFVSGGENVHPEVIEDTLADHPGVTEVGVIGIPHDTWGTTPMAIVVGGADRDTLDAFARENLADYEAPRAYEFVDELPRSGPGKLDRDALREQYGSTEVDR